MNGVPPVAGSGVPAGRAFQAAEVAARVGGILYGEDVALTGVAALESIGPGLLAFHDRGPLADGPGAVLTRRPVAHRTCIVVEDPLAAFVRVLEAWYPEPGFEGAIHPTARLGRNVVIHPGVVIGAECEVGDDTVLFPNVVLYARTRIGRRCRIHAGAVLGADGFRYHPTAQGALRVPHVGGVRIGDDVEIGAVSTVDRGFLVDTEIGDGCKLDNLVQIGHNCRLGRSVIIAAQTGVSGSCVIGDGVLIAGQVGFADHLTIGAGARIGARSGVHRDIPSGETWLGAPAMPVAQTMRIFGVWKDLPEMWKAWRKTLE